MADKISEKAKEKALGIAEECAKSWEATLKLWQMASAWSHGALLNAIFGAAGIKSPREILNESLNEYLEGGGDVYGLAATLTSPFDQDAFVGALLRAFVRHLQAETPRILNNAERQEFGEVLKSLMGREAEILTLRFGLGDAKPQSLKAVGERFGVVKQRIHQIEAKALRKLRHPSRARRLRHLLRWQETIEALWSLRETHKQLWEERAELAELASWCASREGISLDELRAQCRAVQERAWLTADVLRKLWLPVGELELSVRASNALRIANIRYVWELVLKSEIDIIRIKNVGRKTMNELKPFLRELGFGFGMRLTDVPPQRPPE